MKDKYVLTAESVTEGHPDKLCDTIADAVVDACLEHDPTAHVACEVMATAGKIIVAGEITAARLPDIPAVVCRTVREAGYGGSDYEVEVITHEQSSDIAGAVNSGAETGAGDQGIVYGYACDETPELLPLPVVLAHKLTCLLTQARKLRTIPSLKPDGKAQVSVEYQFGVPKRVSAVVVSCQHEDGVELAELRHAVMRHIIQPAFQDFPLDAETEILINPSGRFVEGGFEADTGLTGRKLMVDTYGGLAPHMAAARCPARTVPRWIAAEPIWPATSQKTLWRRDLLNAAPSVWPMPSARRSLSWWRWMPTALVSIPILHWSRPFARCSS